ncbi:MAG TPA: hypothetical protein VHL52_06950 [Acidimicrobiia bacterium]|nr:hypothetical protein [Acidimicrobiia bacterium]
MMINPITAVAIAKAIQADRLAEADASRRARAARRGRRRSPMSPTAVHVVPGDEDLVAIRE